MAVEFIDRAFHHFHFFPVSRNPGLGSHDGVCPVDIAASVRRVKFLRQRRAVGQDQNDVGGCIAVVFGVKASVG